MENFFYDDEFYTNIGHMMDDQDIDETMEGIDDQWEIECVEGKLEPLVTLSVDWIMDRIDEERYTENGTESEKVYKLLKEHLDVTKVNELMPKLWYETRKKFTITKQDLIDWCK